MDVRLEENKGGLAVIAGSGMGGLGPALEKRMDRVESVSFDDIEGVGTCSVDGHAGEVRIGRIKTPPDGIDGRQLAIVMGRRHAYEGGVLGMAPLMRWLAGRGTRSVIAVSAAGSLHAGLRAGELVIIRDIIDLQNRAFLQPSFRRAPRRDAPGLETRAARHTGLSRQLSLALEAAARRAGVPVQRGVLACGAGPSYETPAEVQVLRRLGADVATMSAAPEVEYAADSGMKIAVVAAVTNAGTGMGPEPPDHERVMEVGAAMSGGLAKILVQWIENK